MSCELPPFKSFTNSLMVTKGSIFDCQMDVCFGSANPVQIDAFDLAASICDEAMDDRFDFGAERWPVVFDVPVEMEVRSHGTHDSTWLKPLERKPG